jgi:acetyl-CoA acetyltransferase
MIGRKYSRDVAIVGVGMIRWGRYPEKTIQELAAEAVLNALARARSLLQNPPEAPLIGFLP